MKIMNTLLLRRGKGTWLLFLAVLLSTFLAGATVLMISTGRASYFELNYTRYGEEDYILHAVDPAFLASLAEEGIIRKDYGTLNIYGYNLGTEENLLTTFTIASMDANAEKLAHRKLIEGRMPDKPGEIAIEAMTLEVVSPGARVGDTLACRVRIPDGDGGFIRKLQKMEFTIVGILEDQRPYLMQFLGGQEEEPVYFSLPCALVHDSTEMPAGGAFVRNALIVLTERVSWDTMPKRFEDAYFAWARNTGKQCARTEVLARTENGGYMDADLMGTTRLVAVAMVLLLLLCVVGVVSAFSGTLEERTHQLALFRAVGATKAQLARILLNQTLVLTLIAIPFGVVLAFAAVWGIVKILGGFFLFVWDVRTVLVAVVAMFATVFFASLIPVWRASRISPMQAIREVDMQYAMRRRKTKSSRQFRPTSHLALRNFTLHRGAWTGVLLLALIAVFIVSMVIPTYINRIRAVLRENDMPDYFAYVFTEVSRLGPVNEAYPFRIITGEDMSTIRNVFSDADIYTERSIFVHLLIDQYTPYLADGMHKWDAEHPEESHKQFDEYLQCERYGKELFWTYINTVSDLSSVYIAPEYIIEGEIHPDKLASGEEVLVYAPCWADDLNTGLGMQGTPKDVMDAGFENYQSNDFFHAGDTLTITFLHMPNRLESIDNWATPGYMNPEDIVQEIQKVKIGAVLYKSRSNLIGPPNTGKILTLDSALDAWGWEKPDPETVEIWLKHAPTEEERELYRSTLEALTQESANSYYVDSSQMAQTFRDTNQTIVMVASGIALIFFAATAALVNRTLSAQIRGSARTIGMLRAVGADRGSIARMYGLQVLIVLLLGSVIGVVLGVALSQIQQYMYFPLKEMLPIAAVLVPVYLAALIGLCMLHVHARIGEIYRKSVTENIREL